MEIYELNKTFANEESTIWVNTAHIVSIEPYDDARLVVHMTNGESYYIPEKDSVALRTLLHASKAN